MKNSKISLIEIKRYLKKKGLDIIKKKNNSTNVAIFWRCGDSCKPRLENKL